MILLPPTNKAATRCFSISHLKKLLTTTLIVLTTKLRGTMANVTGDGEFTSKLNQAFGEQEAGIFAFFSALNFLLSITASLGNALILVALHEVTSIYPPTKLFFRCLAVTDLCVGFVVQPLFATSMLAPFTNMNTVNALNHVLEAHDVLALFFCGISLLTSTAISVDRLLALLLGLRYRHVVTLRRVRAVIICFWLLLGSNTAIWPWENNIGLLITPFYTTLSVATSVFCYTRIHVRLRHHQVQQRNHVPQGQPNDGRIPLNIARYKKTIASVLWVQLALFACYIPIGVTFALDCIGIQSHGVVFLTTNSLVYFNSSLNPILYCWKIKEVKKAVKDTIRQLYCL